MTDISALDSQDLFGMAYALPDHIELARRAANNVDELPAKERIENIVVLGMGASGAAGDFLAASLASILPIPVTVVKGYELPAFVNDSSLVFAISFSGNTEETVEAASEAAVQGARIVVITSGGRLADLAGEWSAPVVRIPGSIPQPRAAIGLLAIPAIVVLERMGLFPGASQWLDLAVEQLHVRREQLAKPGNMAEELALKLVGKIPLIQGGGALGGAIAQRWKSQINENAKSVAFWGQQPELCHGEAVGWDALPEVTKERFAIVALRHDDEHPQVVRRFELVYEHIESQVASIDQVQAEGDGTLAQLFDLVMIGDYVSLHMAIAEGIDPAPVDYLLTLKAALSER